jgi:hypothetical protein
MGILTKAYNSKPWKAVRKVTGDRYGRFNSKSSTLGYNIPKIVSDVKTLATMVNAEKKRIEVQPGQFLLAQSNTTLASGHVLLDLTPTIAQGITYNTRNGSSVKLHSSVMKFQVSQQTNFTSKMKIKIYIVKVIGAPIFLDTGKFLDPNPFTTFYDFNSSRNIDKMSQFKVITTRNYTVQPDNIAGQNNKLEFMIAWKHKGDSHLRYDKDSNSLTKGQFFMICVADNGDIATAVQTGVGIQYTARHFYYDN